LDVRSTAQIDDDLHRDGDRLTVGARAMSERDVHRADVVALQLPELDGSARHKTLVLVVLGHDLVTRSAVRELFEDDARVEGGRGRGLSGDDGARTVTARGRRCGLARQGGDEEDRARDRPCQAPRTRVHGLALGAGVGAVVGARVAGGGVENGFTVEALLGTALGELAGGDVGDASGAAEGCGDAAGSRRAGGTSVSTIGTASPSVPRAVGEIGTKFCCALA
jgi:hypothetical protein